MEGVERPPSIGKRAPNLIMDIDCPIAHDFSEWYQRGAKFDARYFLCNAGS